MTPKEKAQQLFMRNFEITVDDYCAQQCALIAVDEILNNDGFTKFDQYLTEYWMEVKQEIQEL